MYSVWCAVLNLLQFVCIQLFFRFQEYDTDRPQLHNHCLINDEMNSKTAVKNCKVQIFFFCITIMHKIHIYCPVIQSYLKLEKECTLTSWFDYPEQQLYMETKVKYSKQIGRNRTVRLLSNT